MTCVCPDCTVGNEESRINSSLVYFEPEAIRACECMPHLTVELGSPALCIDANATLHYSARVTTANTGGGGGAGTLKCRLCITPLSTPDGPESGVAVASPELHPEVKEQTSNLCSLAQPLGTLASGTSETKGLLVASRTHWPSSELQAGLHYLLVMGFQPIFEQNAHT